MSFVTSALLGFLLAYYWVGLEMVLHHTSLGPVEAPSYVYGSIAKRSLVGGMWPIVAYRNEEFAWFFDVFLSYFVVMTVAYTVIVPGLMGATTLTLVACVARFVPLAKHVVNALFAALGALIWLLVLKPLGCKVPPGINRRHG